MSFSASAKEQFSMWPACNPYAAKQIWPVDRIFSRVTRHECWRQYFIELTSILCSIGVNTLLS